MVGKVVYLMLMLVYLSGIISGNDECIDELGKEKCEFLMKHKACYLSRKRMQNLCPKTCGHCAWQRSCENIFPSSRCERLRCKGACKSHVNFMQQMCAKTCNLCEENYKCKNINCGTGRYCALNSYRKPYCSCRVPCNIQSTSKRFGPVCGSDRVTYMNICVMKQVACKSRTNIYVKRYGNCPKHYSCKDSRKEHRYGFCKRWKRAGLCKHFKKYLIKSCIRTCGFCEKAQDPFSCGDDDPYCCWDGQKAQGPDGLGCRACKDKSRIFCMRFLPDCGSNKQRSRRIMSEMCPASCRFCNEKRKL